jgi:LysR family transcriptional regulator, carnitine catabolism transcriptional activator
MNITLHQLEVFIAVARYGGFTRAAERLFLSQPSLTLLVRQLEEQLQVRLFDRTTRRVELTAAGFELLPVAERLFSELALTAQNLRDLGNVRRGRVVVAALPSMSATLLPQAIALFNAQYPDVQVRLKDGVAAEVFEMVRIGQADLGVGSFSGVEPDLKLTLMTKDRMYLICREGHPLSSLSEVPWRALVDYPFVAMSVGTSVRYTTDRAFAEIGVVKVPEQEVSLLTTMFGLAKAGLAVTAMPATVMRAFNVDGVVELPLVQPIVERELGFVTRRGRTPSPAANALMKSVKQASEAFGTP